MNEHIKAGAEIHAGDGGYSEGTQEKYDEFVKDRDQSLGKMRIKELAKQSGLNAPYGSDHEGLSDFDYRKFAELIVRECAKVASNADLEDVDGGDSAVLRAASEQIKEHFGVE